MAISEQAFEAAASRGAMERRVRGAGTLRIRSAASALSAQGDEQRPVWKRPLEPAGIGPRGREPALPLLWLGQDHRHGLGVDDGHLSGQRSVELAHQPDAEQRTTRAASPKVSRTT